MHFFIACNDVYPVQESHRETRMLSMWFSDPNNYLHNLFCLLTYIRLTLILFYTNVLNSVLVLCFTLYAYIVYRCKKCCISTTYALFIYIIEFKPKVCRKKMHVVYICSFVYDDSTVYDHIFDFANKTFFLRLGAFM